MVKEVVIDLISAPGADFGPVIVIDHFRVSHSTQTTVPYGAASIRLMTHPEMNVLISN